MWRLIGFTVLATLLLGGCATASMAGYGQGGMDADGRSYEASADDNRLTGKVTQALVRHRRVSTAWITVESHNGVVTLSGRVPTKEQKLLASHIVQDIPGVYRVENRLQADH